jgi:hypothetical protein
MKSGRRTNRTKAQRTRTQRTRAPRTKAQRTRTRRTRAPRTKAGRTKAPRTRTRRTRTVRRGRVMKGGTGVEIGAGLGGLAALTAASAALYRRRRRKNKVGVDQKGTAAGVTGAVDQSQRAAPRVTGAVDQSKQAAPAREGAPPRWTRRQMSLEDQQAAAEKLQAELKAIRDENRATLPQIPLKSDGEVMRDYNKFVGGPDGSDGGTRVGWKCGTCGAGVKDGDEVIFLGLSPSSRAPILRCPLHAGLEGGGNLPGVPQTPRTRRSRTPPPRRAP